LRFLEGEAGGCGAGSELDSRRLWRLALMRAPSGCAPCSQCGRAGAWSAFWEVWLSGSGLSASAATLQLCL